MKPIIFLFIPRMLSGLLFRPDFTFTVSGIISDGKENPLPSVTIVKRAGTSLHGAATISKSDGSYTINVTNSNGKLVFTAAGYETKEVIILGRNIINVNLSYSRTR